MLAVIGFLRCSDLVIGAMYCTLPSRNTALCHQETFRRRFEIKCPPAAAVFPQLDRDLPQKNSPVGIVVENGFAASEEILETAFLDIATSQPPIVADFDSLESSRSSLPALFHQRRDNASRTAPSRRGIRY
jgi:hypothetical protein